MKFKGEPNLLVRITKPKKGEVKHFRFDENGIYETNHPFTIQRLRATYQEITEDTQPQEITEDIKPIVDAESEPVVIPLEEIPEDQIRELAKEKKIKNWHNKKIGNLILELKEES